jgi:Ca2+-binding RTX toxin-like protein
VAFSSSIDLGALDGTIGFRLNGAARNDFSGYSVASAGDVNGDGYDDLIVGAKSADPNGSNSGASYVVFGKASGFAASLDLSTLDGTTGFRLNGAAAGDKSGTSVASAGDLNGDGYDDLIVGANGADPNGSYSGASYVVFGKASGFAASFDLSTLDGTTGFRLNGAAAGDNVGRDVASAGDVNGDGYDDLIVSAHGADLNGSTSGASYVVFGKASGFAVSLELSTLDGTNGFRLNGAAAEDFSGYSVASAGDVNGDGYDDLIVGAVLADPNGSNSGASYVVFGKASGFAASLDLSILDGTTGFRLNGAAAGDRSGTSVASAGDLNGDGYDDLIVGALYADPNGSNSGASYVVFGKASGFAASFDLSTLDGTTGFRLNGAAAGDNSGRAVASAGDVNGDGYDDLIVGAQLADPNGSSSGASYVVFGKASGFAASLDLSILDGTTGFRLNGAAAGDRSGTSVASAGDVNGDGYDDLIVGALYADPNGSSSGASYVVFGGASGDTPVTTIGTAADEMLIGGIGADVLTGGGGADLFRGGAGDDRLVVSDLAFREADGGSGTDTLGLDGAGLVLDLTTALAARKLEGIERIDLTGTGANTLKIDSAALLGGVGAASDGKHVLTVLGNAGDSVVFGEAGWTKTGFFDEGGTLFDRWEQGTAIIDIQRGVGAGVPLTGGPGADVLHGSESNDILDGAAGDDRLVGGAGADLMVGGTGNDTYVVEDAGDVAVEAAGGGTDTVETTLSSFTLGAHVEKLKFIGSGGFSGTGNELGNALVGGTGHDMLYGLDGNDRLVGGAGADLMVGGAGDDTYVVDDAGDVAVEAAGEGTDTVETTLSSFTLGAHVEKLKFIGSGGFSGTGNELGNALVGGTGDDMLYGLDGNDRLVGGAGADLMVGGAGDDTYVVEDAGDVVVEAAGEGTDTVETTLSSFTLGAHVEKLKFIGSGGFSGTGNELGNALVGGTGHDMLYGLDGNDRLVGGAGNDTLMGGAGADLLDGGVGADIFVFRDALESTHVSRDTIGDFTPGTDRVDFTQMVSGGGFHALQTVMSAPATIDAHSLVALVGTDGNTVLYVNDTDAAQTTRNASMEILFKGVTTLADADIDYLSLPPDRGHFVV